MAIHGLNKLTLLDYPEKVACTIFMGHCNFRCPFCQNSSLVLDPASQPVLDLKDILSFLEKRKGILDAVCISGGEPTLLPELFEIIEKIKSLDYLVKLDTNGYRPDILKKLLSEKMLDMVAMDIKSSKENYSKLAGIDVDISLIERSVDLLMESDIPYEFRTTVVKELHDRNDFESIGKWLAGCRAYYLQAYKDSPDVIKSGFTSYTYEELQGFANLLRRNMPLVEIRGI